MTKKRFIWKIQDNRGFIYDRLTKNEWKKNKRLVDLLNNIWEQTKRFEKENQRLNEENQRLREKEDEFDMVLKSYRDYYGMDIRNAEWYGFIERCYSDD